jgi:nucleoside-diphosphate-sugar epimerase
VAAQIRRAAATGGEVRLGPLDAFRDFVDARDVADAAVAAALAPSLPAAVINIGSGSATSVRDLVTGLTAVSGYDGPVIEGDGGTPAARAGAAPVARSWQQADISRARRDLGWSPRRDLACSLADLWSGRRAA